MWKRISALVFCVKIKRVMINIKRFGIFWNIIYWVIFMRYDREKAVEYARKWALSRNPQYLSYDNLGGRLY